MEYRAHESAEGFLLRAHRPLSDLDPDEIDAFIIAGGDQEPVLGDTTLSQKLSELNERGALAAICGGPICLSQAGFLEARRFTSPFYATR